MSSKKQADDKDKKKCTTFEPQAWRRTKCKNCFRTEPEHKEPPPGDGTKLEEPKGGNDSAKKSPKAGKKSNDNTKTTGNSSSTSKTAPSTAKTDNKVAGKTPAIGTTKDKQQTKFGPIKDVKTPAHKSIGKTDPSDTSTKTLGKSTDKSNGDISKHTPGKGKSDPGGSSSKEKDTNKDSLKTQKAADSGGGSDKSKKLYGGKDLTSSSASPAGNTKIDSVVQSVQKQAPSSGITQAGSNTAKPGASVKDKSVKSTSEVKTDVKNKQSKSEVKKSEIKHEDKSSKSGENVVGKSNTVSAPSSKSKVKEEEEKSSKSTGGAVNNDVTLKQSSKQTTSKSPKQYEEESTSFGADDSTSHSPDLYHHFPESDQYDRSRITHDNITAPNIRNIYEEEQNRHNQQSLKEHARGLRLRQGGCVDDFEYESQRRRLHDYNYELSRDEALLEGNRILMDNLRSKLDNLETKNDKLEREKQALSELLSVKKREYVQTEDGLRNRIDDLESEVKRITTEKERLLDHLKLPESERGSLKHQENEIAILRRKLDESDGRLQDAMSDSIGYKQEIRDLHLEMEELHDQFRDDEALEFRELQKELEATAKNCRILQFKLRKVERRSDQLESDRIQYEDKIRQLESRFEASDDKMHIRELEEELKMAKEVSVRLHDELELVEEKRCRYEEELDRVNDILTETDSRRVALQKEVERLSEEVMSYRRQLQHATGGSTETLDVPRKTPGLSTLSRESSQEYDVTQIMRDLSDSLERENDVKEQLKFAEEECRNYRKKLHDLEQENESLTLQLQKMSSAKSGKYFTKKTDSKDSSGTASEREHELRLQMELAEQELKVLHRKMDEMESENENLRKQIKFLEHSKAASAKTVRTTDDLESMAQDIDQLKWKLIEKDQESDRLRSKRGSFKKSRSLEEYGGGETEPDIRRQLETVQREAVVLKERLGSVESEYEKLQAENSQLQIQGAKPGKSVPAIKTDDSALQNIELRDRIKTLDTENAALKHKIRTLDERTRKLSKDITSVSSRSGSLSDSQGTRELKDRCANLEGDQKRLHRKMAEVESQNKDLTRELNKYKRNEGKSSSGDYKDVAKLTREELKEKVWSLEGQVKALQDMVTSREDENKGLEAEIRGYQEDMDKMFDSFQSRERELVDEIETLTQRNHVISNLLEVVTERAENQQTELDKITGDSPDGKSERSASVVSAISDTSLGSDEVFTATGDSKLVTKNWEEQFRRRISCLEEQLADEKKKVESAEKKLNDKNDNTKTKKNKDAKMQEKEKGIVKQELELSQKQLKEASEEIKELKERLKLVQQAHDGAKEDLLKKSKEFDKQLKKYKDDKEKNENESRGKATWRWEKQELEKQVKEYKKKIDEMHEELKRQQFKWKMAGEDAEREQKMKLQMQGDIQKLKTEADKYMKDIEGFKTKITEMDNTLKKKETEWKRQNELLESAKNAAEREARQKAEYIKQKDDIIKQKDDLIKTKDEMVTKKEKLLTKRTKEVETREKEAETANSKVSKLENELSRVKLEVEEVKSISKERENKLKHINDDIRRRDDRLKEKDEILQQINRKLVDKENEVKDMDKTIRSAMKKLSERESDVKKFELSAKKAESEVTSLTDKINELNTKIEKTERKHMEEKASTVAEFEQLETDLSTAQRERKTLQDELNKLKESSKKEEEKRQQKLEKLELELKQAKDKIQTHKISSTMSESEALKSMAKEKEKLVVDKHRLTEDTNQLQKDLKDLKSSQEAEKDKLKKEIADKSRKLDESSKKCTKLQNEAEKLKQQVSSSSPAPKLTPIPVLHETSKSSSEADLSSKLERQELIFNAEKISLQEGYESKVYNLQDQLSHAQNQVDALRYENDAQLELIQSSRMALSDLRKRYDAGLISWNESREMIERKLKQLEARQDDFLASEKAMNEMKSKLMKEEAKCKEIQNKLTAEKTVWNNEKTSLQNRLKKVDGGASSSSQATKVSEFRAKFEKFGPPKGKKVGSPTPDDEISTSDEYMIDTEAIKKATKELQEQLSALEKQRIKDRDELIKKLDSCKVDWEQEKREMRDRNRKLEDGASELYNVQKSMMELQVRTAEDKENWAIERSQLHKQLENTKREQLKDKEKMGQLMAEVKKLKAITPMLESQASKTVTSPTTPDAKKGSSATIIRVRGVSESSDAASAAAGSDEVKNTMDQPLAEYVSQALQHISKLLEDYNSRAQVTLRPTSDRKKPPPVFRRSLSLSEVEVTPSTPETLRSSHYTQYTATPPNKSIVMDRQARSRAIRRAFTSTDPEYDSQTLDRRYRSAKDVTHSIYHSGTRSAFGSRDASPDRSSHTSLPLAPPSMIITPSTTPQRERSMDRSTKRFTEHDMNHLYAKLGEIDHNKHGVTDPNALAKERGSGIRVLTKSVSVDTPQDDVPSWIPNRNPSPYAVTPTDNKSKSFIAIARIHSKLFEDAPKSQVLPASIRIGELVITPGIDKLSKLGRKERKRAESVSPKTARRKFYDNYSFDPKSYFSWSRGSSKEDSGRRRESYDKSDLDPGIGRGRARTDTNTSRDSSEGGDSEKSTSSRKSKFSQFFSETRKRFGAKRSSSVDNSPLQSTVVKAGVEALTPGAPTTYNPPDVKVVEPVHKEKEKRKLFKHRRAASVDTMSALSTNQHSSTSPTTSFGIHFPSLRKRDETTSSSSSKLNRGRENGT